jgi:hypothetical protein
MQGLLSLYSGAMSVFETDIIVEKCDDTINVMVIPGQFPLGHSVYEFFSGQVHPFLLVICSLAIAKYLSLVSSFAGNK